MVKLSKRQRTFNLLTHSARVLFEQKGVEGVTFDDIAEHANVCRTTVFNHFPTSNDLLVALCRVEIENLLKLVSESNEQGVALIRKLFNQLIDDTSKYPIVMTKLTTSYVTQPGETKGAIGMEETIVRNIEIENKNRPLAILNVMSASEVAILLMGYYFGLVNNHHAYNKPFNAVELKAQFGKMIDNIIA